MVRKIYAIDIEEAAGYIQIRVRGNGFLYNMLRRIVGMLIEVGLGEAEAEHVTTVLNSEEHSQTGYIADAFGLYLEKIQF